jgi:flagellar basal body-associated protein FliL
VADDRERDTEHTTIVTRDGDGRGSAGIMLIVALIVIVLAVLFFTGVFDRNDNSDLNVTVNSPDVNVIVPETQLPPLTTPVTQPPPPDVNVNVSTPPPEPPTDNLSNTTNLVNNGR